MRLNVLLTNGGSRHYVNRRGGGSGDPTDSGYTQISSTGYAFAALKTEVVPNVNNAPTGSVTISGMATEDQTLAASNTLADEDRLGAISYQWNRDDVAIARSSVSPLATKNWPASSSLALHIHTGSLHATQTR